MARTRATTHGAGDPPQPADAAAQTGPAGQDPFEADTVRDLHPTPGGGGTLARARTLGLSVPGALVGTLLITALAFGVGGFNPIGSTHPLTAEPTSGKTADASPEVADGTNGGAEDAAEDGKPGGDAGETDASQAPDETAKPDRSDAPEATPPAPRRLELDARAGDGKVRLDWSACDPERFAYYKVVRSTDEKVTWPKGDNDTLIAAIEDPASSAWTDSKPTLGRKLWYRVFGLVEVDGSLVVGCISNIAGVTVPKPPEPTPEPATLRLTVVLKDGHPWLDWSGCASDKFDYYKVVRSKDATVTWPTGENDVLAAAIGNPAESALWDKDAPGGKTLYYRVFCVDKTETGYRVLASSVVKSVTTPAPEPPPDPVTLGFEASVGEGGVLLDWESCGSDGFVYYKVVRSASPNPSYLPWTEGSELIGVIESPGNSAFEDSAVEAGQTWFYRVQAIGYWNGQKVVLGQTRVLEVSVP